MSALAGLSKFISPGVFLWVLTSQESQPYRCCAHTLLGKHLLPLSSLLSALPLLLSCHLCDKDMVSFIASSSWLIAQRLFLFLFLGLAFVPLVFLHIPRGRPHHLGWLWVPTLCRFTEPQAHSSLQRLRPMCLTFFQKTLVVSWEILIQSIQNDIHCSTPIFYFSHMILRSEFHHCFSVSLSRNLLILSSFIKSY